MDTFGTNDKLALVVGTLALLAVFAAGLGAVAVRHLWPAVGGIAAFGLVGALSAASRPGRGPLHAVPAVVGAVAASAALWALRGPLAHRSPAPPGRPSAADRLPTGFDRRRFLFGAAAIGGGAAAAGGVGRLLQRRFEVGAARDAVALPAAASPAVPLPARADLGVPGITPFVTPNRRLLPGRHGDRGAAGASGRLAAADRRHGRPARHPQLRGPAVAAAGRAGPHPRVRVQQRRRATWRATPAGWASRWRTSLHEAGVHRGADQLVSRSVDGFTAGTPVSAVLDGRDAMVAVGMNGEPLPVAHGFPARLVVPGLYGYTSATKWLEHLELTTFDAYDAVLGEAGLVARGADQDHGPHRHAEGPGPRARRTGAGRWRGLGPPPGHRGGRGPGRRRPVAAGRVSARCPTATPGGSGCTRGTPRRPGPDGTRSPPAPPTGPATVQTSTRADPKPDGASGWHSIVVEVR